MSTVEILTPVGRLVQGSLYKPQTKDATGNLIIIKTGVNAGKPGFKFYFAIAIPKSGEPHWNQTIWGKIIWNTGHLAFPQGQADTLKFAWKIEDGDSQIQNGNHKRPCDQPGFSACWIVRFSSSFAPTVWHPIKKQEIIEKDFINAGDYIQVFGNVLSNNSQQQPGVHLNHKYVAFLGYGERILFGRDPEEVEFETALPVGASAIPQGITVPTGSQEQDITNLIPHSQQVPMLTPGLAPNSVVTPTVVIPHTQILQPPMPPVPTKRLTAKAGGSTYEAFIAAGWTDTLLIRDGYLEP